MGPTPKGTQVISGINCILEGRLTGMCVLDVVDASQQPLLASHAEVTVVLTLVREHPLSLHNRAGHLGCEPSVLARLDLEGG